MFVKLRSLLKPKYVCFIPPQLKLDASCYYLNKQTWLKTRSPHTFFHSLPLKGFLLLLRQVFGERWCKVLQQLGFI